MNGTAAHLASITTDVIWIPYSIFIVLTIAVLAFSFVRYHRRKIAQRKYAKEYADENLQIKRARISGITCNSNDMRLKDLASSMMDPGAFRLYSDLSIQTLPNFARHNLDLRSSKSAEDGSIDVNKIVIEDWMEQTELKVLRNQKTISAGFHHPEMKSIKSAEDGSIDVNKIVIEDWMEQAELQEPMISRRISSGFNKDSLGCFHKHSSAGLHEESSEGFRKDISESFDLVEIGIDDVCESCKTTVLQYHERKRPHRLKTLAKSQDMIQPYCFENATHQLTYDNNKYVKSTGTTDVPQNTVDTVASTVETIAFTTSDIYAKPKKKQWTHISDTKRNIPKVHTGVSENTADTVASTVDIDRVLSERKRYENSKNRVAHQRKTLPKRKRSFHRKSLSKNRRVNSLSMSHNKRTSRGYVNTYHKRPGSQMTVATDYSSTTSSEREFDDEYRPYEEIWSGHNEFRQAFNQNRKGSQNIQNAPSQDASTSDKRYTKSDRNRTKRLQKSRLPGTHFDNSETGTGKLKATLKMTSFSDFDTTVKKKLPQSNSSSETSVIIEKQLLVETLQINANSIEKAELSGKLKMESNSDPGIPKKTKVGLHAKSEDKARSIAYRHQLIKSTSLQNPSDQYFNYTDAEKMKQVAPKNIDNRSGDIYWLDIHNEDTMV